MDTFILIPPVNRCQPIDSCEQIIYEWPDNDDHVCTLTHILLTSISYYYMHTHEQVAQTITWNKRLWAADRLSSTEANTLVRIMFMFMFYFFRAVVLAALYDHPEAVDVNIVSVNVIV